MDAKLLPLNSRVLHTGHGAGTIVSYNGSAKNEYIEKNFGKAILNEVVKAGLYEAVVASMYNGDRYPYVIQFDSGYKDVYSLDDVTELK